MDEGGKPYVFIIWALIAIIVILTIALLVIVYTFRKGIRKKVKYLKKTDQIPEDEVIEKEIISIIEEGHEQGVILDSEAEMIHNIFEFGDKEAKDIMTHRKNIVAIDGNMIYSDALAFIIETGRSRFPVYLDDIDNIIGILYIKDAISYCRTEEIFYTAIKDLPQLLRDVDFITETLSISALFTKMQSAKTHICVVIDEYGQTAGLVAMEDILEVIVGDIEDEHDEEEQSFLEEADGSFTFDGLTELPDVLEVIELPVAEDAFETLNGYVISILEKIPNDGECETVSAHGYLFEIMEVENRIIRKVRISYCSD